MDYQQTTAVTTSATEGTDKTDYAASSSPSLPLNDLILSTVASIGNGRMVLVSRVVSHKNLKTAATTFQLQEAIDKLIPEQLIRERRGVVSLKGAEATTINVNMNEIGSKDDWGEEPPKKEVARDLSWHITNFGSTHNFTMVSS
jgi:hypothetical protein